VPFAIGHNKLILVNKSYHARYIYAMRQLLKDRLPGSEFLKKNLFGHEVISIL